MKAWLAVLLAAFLGVGAGTVFAIARYSAWARGSPLEGKARTTIGGPHAARPQVHVDNDTYDFGTMDVNGSGRHDFIIKNTGTAPLELTKGPTSCKCTLAEMNEKTVVPPGGETKVGLSWTAKGFLGPFRQTATLLSNDPDRSRVLLTVTGRISVAARAVPAELVFSRIMAGQDATATVQVFGYRPEPLQLKDFRWSDSQTANSFEARILPLPADQIKNEEGATSGCLLEVRVKSGLPLGPFQQKISLATNLKQTPTIEIPIRGKIASDLSIVGPGWSEEDGLLMLGTIRSEEGTKRTLLIVAGGPRAREVRCEPVEVFPDTLRVEIGTPQPARDGTVIQTPVTITIPPGSPPADHLGSEQGKLGRITIRTNHPHIPRLRILVRFAVAG